MTVKLIRPVPQSVWEHVFRTDPDATPFQSPSWISGIVATGRFIDESRLYVTPTSNVILPLVGSRVAPSVDVAASLPRGYGTGGMLSDDRLSSDVVAEILESVARSRFSRITIHHARGTNAAGSPRWRTGSRTSHVLGLEGGVEAVFGRMQARKRSAIRRAFRAGLVVESGNSRRLIDTFYDVLLRWWATRVAAPARLSHWLAGRVEPHSKFVHAADAMGDALRVYVVSAGGRAVAGSILVLSPRSAAFWRGVSDLAAPAATGANDLLQGHMIQDACAAGCSSYLMGQSGGVRSLIAYKERLGARPREHAVYTSASLPIAAIADSVRRRITAMLGRSGR